MPVSVAIVGSGPAAFYTAAALVDTGDDVLVDIIERLPTPFGLIRGGISPDHQTTKNITKKFEKTAMSEQVRYFGNVEVGRDLELSELRGIYDAVVLAIGSPEDRTLNIPGADKANVIGAATFVRWYNGHPDFRDLAPDLSISTAVVIGVGNVAMDVSRLLCLSAGELATTDLPDFAETAIQQSPLSDVYMIGRRGPSDAKFTNVELRELKDMAECIPHVRPEQLPDGVEGDYPDRDKRLRERNLETLRQYSQKGGEDKPKRIHIEFFASPVEILGTDRIEGIRMERTRVEEGRAIATGEFFEIPCGLVIPAIGYRGTPLDGAPFDNDHNIIPNEDGRVEDGLYVAGWIKRGPTGVISSNRPDGVAVAGHIIEDFEGSARGDKPGRKALESLLRDRNVRSVSFDDWKKIDAAEIANAESPRPRKKFVTVEAMLDVLG
ncbi:MAG: FAD-dependent oxidoreductase [Alphaproteobacteria bacterium]|jgi:NADPH-dependent glutamate synthase beta subunit-like oxidoreductase|nr:FAD-dependent oxidoreductase [Alphaproteobacteria bacterium]MBT7942240.1 FAD-dependent oxidoreductase [Alphaproteobacteria bacterium]